MVWFHIWCELWLMAIFQCNGRLQVDGVKGYLMEEGEKEVLVLHSDVRSVFAWDVEVLADSLPSLRLYIFEMVGGEGSRLGGSWLKGLLRALDLETRLRTSVPHE